MHIAPAIPNLGEQEIIDGKEMHCATLALDQSGADLQTRVGNRVYEWCRAGKLQLTGFPEFGPIIDSLRDGAKPAQTKAYNVCTQQANKLVVLESLASKWIENESTKERANAAIESHNATYNPDGDFWFSDVSRTCVSRNGSPFQNFV